jgi:hypothetical protein
MVLHVQREEKEAMSLKPEPIGPIPQETIRVAKAACPKGNTFIHMRDALGVLFEDSMFVKLFPADGQPALARLPLGSGDLDAIRRRVIRSSSG